MSEVYGIPAYVAGSMMIVAAVSFLLTVVGTVLWRRDRLLLGIFAGAFVAMLIGGSLGQWDHPVYFAWFYLLSCATGMVAYSLLRWRVLGFGPPAALAAAAVNSVAVLLSTYAMAMAGWLDGSMGPVWVVPVSGLTALVIALVALLARAVVRAGAAQGAPGGDPEATREDRRSVMRMLADGKISGEEAAQLIEALGRPDTPGDGRPLGGARLASLAGGLTVAVGFVLPWGWVHIGSIQGYQAGYGIGLLGWVILLLGLLPALLACLPVLDAHLRQAMLRLLLAGTGLVFALSLVVQALASQSAPGTGLLIVLLGFGVQLLSALAGTGLLRGSGEQAAA